MLHKYKYWLITFFLLAMISAGLFAVQPAPANQITDRHRVESNLLKMEKAGISNPDFYNQLGLSYFRQGKTGKAVLCFLRALRLNSSHHDSRNNLTYVMNLTLDKDMYTQPSFLASFFQSIFEFFSLNALAWIVLGLLLVTVSCIHWLLHLPLGRDKAVPIMWLVIFGFIFLVFTTMLSLKYKGYHDDSKAVVMDPVVEGFSGPGPEYGKLFNLHEGLIININRVDKDWALITLPNGGAGWVQVFRLERVKP